MCKIQTEITMKATRESVWKILTDFKAYPDWNPFLTRIDEVDDKKLIIEITSGRSKMLFKPTITKKEPQSELRWIGRLGGIRGLFTGEHYFILSKLDKGMRLIHGENFSGILAYLLWLFIKKDIRANFIKMNEALKAVVEKAS